MGVSPSFKSSFVEQKVISNHNSYIYRLVWLERRRYQIRAFRIPSTQLTCNWGHQLIDCVLHWIAIGSQHSCSSIICPFEQFRSDYVLRRRHQRHIFQTFNYSALKRGRMNFENQYLLIAVLSRKGKCLTLNEAHSRFNRLYNVGNFPKSVMHWHRTRGLFIIISRSISRATLTELQCIALYVFMAHSKPHALVSRDCGECCAHIRCGLEYGMINDNLCSAFICYLPIIISDNCELLNLPPRQHSAHSVKSELQAKNYKNIEKETHLFCYGRQTISSIVIFVYALFLSFALVLQERPEVTHAYYIHVWWIDEALRETIKVRTYFGWYAASGCFFFRMVDFSENLNLIQPMVSRDALPFHQIRIQSSVGPLVSSVFGCNWTWPNQSLFLFGSLTVWIRRIWIHGTFHGHFLIKWLRTTFIAS